jgi:hypothetical protein
LQLSQSLVKEDLKIFAARRVGHDFFGVRQDISKQSKNLGRAAN